MRHLGDGLKVRHVVPGVPNGLDVDGLGAVVDGGRDGLGAVSLDELGIDAEAREQDLELVVGAAVQIAGGHDVVSDMGQRRDGHELGGLAGGCCHGGDTTFERGDALLKDIDGGLEGDRLWLVLLARDSQDCVCVRS